MAVTLSGLLTLLPHVMHRFQALRRGRGPVRSRLFLRMRSGPSLRSDLHPRRRLLLLNLSVWLKVCALGPRSLDGIVAPLINHWKITLWKIMTPRVKQTENPTGSSPGRGWSCCTSLQTMMFPASRS